jgi:hypothetical protein
MQKAGTAIKISIKHDFDCLGSVTEKSERQQMVDMQLSNMKQVDQ